MWAIIAPNNVLSFVALSNAIFTHYPILPSSLTRLLVTLLTVLILSFCLLCSMSIKFAKHSFLSIYFLHIFSQHPLFFSFRNVFFLATPVLASICTAQMSNCLFLIPCTSVFFISIFLRCFSHGPPIVLSASFCRTESLLPQIFFSS